MFLLLLPAQSWAWGQKGHRIIAQIAYTYLDDAVREHIDHVLGTHGAVYWANWPDEIKSDTIYPQSHSWHYQDFDADLPDSIIVASLTEYPTEGGELFRAIDSLIVILSQRPDDVHVLRFLIHLSGDRFCPMHTAHMDDMGGNRVKMQWFGHPSNLHAVWDTGIIEARGYSYSEYAQYLIDRYGGERMTIRHMSLEQITVHNYHTVAAIYDYQQTWDGNSYHYLYRWADTAEYQLYVAGVRLADLLNSIYLIR